MVEPPLSQVQKMAIFLRCKINSASRSVWELRLDQGVCMNPHPEMEFLVRVHSMVTAFSASVGPLPLGYLGQKLLGVSRFMREHPLCCILPY